MRSKLNIRESKDPHGSSGVSRENPLGAWGRAFVLLAVNLTLRKLTSSSEFSCYVSNTKRKQNYAPCGGVFIFASLVDVKRNPTPRGLYQETPVGCGASLFFPRVMLNIPLPRTENNFLEGKNIIRRHLIGGLYMEDTF